MVGPVVRGVTWGVQRVGVRTLQVIALLLVVLISVSLGLGELVRGLSVGLLWPTAVAGVLLGWGLARAPLPGGLAGVLAGVLGTEAIVLRVGRLGGPLWALLRALVRLAWWALPLGNGTPDLMPVSLAWIELWSAIGALSGRVRAWLAALSRGEAAFEPVAAALAWSLALWAVAVWAGWSVRRREQPFQAVLPAGVLLATGLSYAGGSPYALALFLGATWLLMALVGQEIRERDWVRRGTDFSLEVRFDLTMMAVLISLSLMMASMVFPSVSVQEVARFARRWMVEHLGSGKQVADSLGLEPLTGSQVMFEGARAAGLPRRHLLGSGPELSRQVVMSVQILQDAGAEAGAPYYWRSLTYDRYTGRGWETGRTKSVTYRAGTPAILDAAQEVPSLNPFQRVVRQKVRAVSDLGQHLYVAGELWTVDHDFRVAWRAPDDAFGAQIAATTYEAESLLPRLTENQLRAAGIDYPQEIAERYLALPDAGIPPRVLALAREVTIIAPTPYDKVRAIEGYLRTFTYTLDVPAPPPERDVADYFLFDLQRGYCDYYATAMIVLARMAGLPARLAVGYASGTYDPEDARYVVTEADAHSWVEIYFSGYGWIAFEPTAGRAGIERPLPVAAPQELPAPSSAWFDQVGWLILLVVLVILGLLGLAALTWWVVDGWRLQRQPPLMAVGTIYQRLWRHGHALAVAPKSGCTPFEFAAQFTGRVRELAQGRRWGDASMIVQQVHGLTTLYVRGLYSPRRIDSTEKRQAIGTWRQLRWRLWLARLWQRRSG